jgi:hypothetical protein
MSRCSGLFVDLWEDGPRDSDGRGVRARLWQAATSAELL